MVGKRKMDILQRAEGKEMEEVGREKRRRDDKTLRHVVYPPTPHGGDNHVLANMHCSKDKSCKKISQRQENKIKSWAMQKKFQREIHYIMKAQLKENDYMWREKKLWRIQK